MELLHPRGSALVTSSDQEAAAEPTQPTPRRTSRRSLLLAGAAVGAGAAIAPLSTSRAFAATGAISVVSANILQTLKWDKFIVDLDRAAYGAHLLGLNEAYKWRPQLAYWAAVRGFTIYQSDGPEENVGTNVLLGRSSMFELLDAGFERSHPGGPNRRHPLPTYINWARWRERVTGIQIVHINTHTTRGIEVRGKPSYKYGDGRVRLAAEQLTRVGQLADFVRRGGLEVIVTGDLNVDWKKDRIHQDKRFPYAILEHSGRIDEPGLRSCWSMYGTPGVGTWKNRYIDYIYEWVRVPSKRKIAMTGVQIVDLLHSDHDAVLATFALNSAGHANG
jgi:hypothetical protein